MVPLRRTLSRVPFRVGASEIFREATLQPEIAPPLLDGGYNDSRQSSLVCLPVVYIVGVKPSMRDEYKMARQMHYHHKEADQVKS